MFLIYFTFVFLWALPKTTGQWQKGLPFIARSRMCPTNSLPLATLIYNKLRGGHSIVFTRMSKFAGILVLRIANRKRQRTQFKIVCVLSNAISAFC